MKKLILAALAAPLLSGCFTTVIKFNGKAPAGEPELDQYRVDFGNEQIVLLDHHCKNSGIAEIEKQYSAKNMLLSEVTLGFMHREDVSVRCAAASGGEGKSKKAKKKS